MRPETVHLATSCAESAEVAEGMFEGAKAGGRKAVSQPEPGAVEVDAKPAGDGDNLAEAFELPPGEA